MKHLKFALAALALVPQAAKLARGAVVYSKVFGVGSATYRLSIERTTWIEPSS